MNTFKEALSSLPGQAIIALMVWSLTVQTTVAPNKRKYWYMALLALFVAYIPFYFWLNSSPGKICQEASSAKIYRRGISHDRSNYLNVQGQTFELGKVTTDFETLRQTELKNLLHKADSTLLSKRNRFSYEEKIGSFLDGKDEISAKIMHDLFKDRYLYINEKVEDCTYSVAMSLAFTKTRSIDSIISLGTESSCLKNTIDDLVMDPLIKNGEVSLSFYHIFSTLCATCPKDARVIYWLKGNAGKEHDADSVYFEKGKYELSLTSMVILKYVAASLSKHHEEKFRIELHGFTDPSRVLNGIPYEEAGHYAATPGQLLPGGIPLTIIKDNIQLSYARAYSCYNYLNDRLDLRRVKLFYTGDGVYNSQGIPDPHQRAVTIYIKKEN